jgi:hypothetical protein
VIGVVHLVWGPLGPEPLREFVASYRAHPAGVEHELVVLLNGVADPSLLSELDGVEHRTIEFSERVQDLAAYHEAARQLEHERLCFVNSYSVILCEGWLAHLDHALSQPDVGMAGATGSWESQAEWRRGAPRYWLYQLSGLRQARREYPPFPNPHVRTTGFIIERDVLLSLGFDGAIDKRAAYLIESGKNGIAKRLELRGLRMVVVASDGEIFEADEWPRSGTFRLGDQENLLISDNQTRAYQGAWHRLRRRLTRASWGADTTTAAARATRGR